MSSDFHVSNALEVKTSVASQVVPAVLRNDQPFYPHSTIARDPLTFQCPYQSNCNREPLITLKFNLRQRSSNIAGSVTTPGMYTMQRP